MQDAKYITTYCDTGDTICGMHSSITSVDCNQSCNILTSNTYCSRQISVPRLPSILHLRDQQHDNTTAAHVTGHNAVQVAEMCCLLLEKWMRAPRAAG